MFSWCVFCFAVARTVGQSNKYGIITSATLRIRNVSCAFVPFLCLCLSVAIVTIQRLLLPQLAPWGTLSLIRALVPLCTVPNGAAIAANFCIAIWCHCCSVAVAIFGCGHYSSPVIAPRRTPTPVPVTRISLELTPPPPTRLSFSLLCKLQKHKKHIQTLFDNETFQRNK